MTHPHKPFAPWRPQRRAWDTCQHVRLERGQLIECGAPTKGRTYCVECREKTKPVARSQYSGPQF